MCGVPQGLILRNVFYDELLDLEMSHDVQLVAFVDDVCVVGNARNGELVATHLNPVLELVAT